MSRYMDSTTQMAELLGKHWRCSGTSRTKFVGTHHQKDCYGKDNSRKFCWNLDLFVHRKQWLFLSVHVEDFKKWMERSRIWLPCGRNRWKCGSWRTNIIAWPRNVNANRMKLFLRNTQRCQDHVFLQEQLKSYQGGKSLTQRLWHGPMIWKDMLENALSGTASWQTRKWSSFTMVAWSLLGWSSVQAGRAGINWRVTKSMLANCFDMLVPGTKWKTRHYVVGQQICMSSHKIDSNGRQTIGKIDFAHSSHKWLPTILSCGQHRSVLSTVCISRFKKLRKPNICLHRLDVQETDISIPQVYRIRNHFFGCRIAHGWTACSRSLGRGNWSVTFNKQHCETK